MWHLACRRKKFEHTKIFWGLVRKYFAPCWPMIWSKRTAAQLMFQTVILKHSNSSFFIFILEKWRNSTRILCLDYITLPTSTTYLSWKTFVASSSKNLFLSPMFVKLSSLPRNTATKICWTALLITSVTTQRIFFLL